MLLDILGKGLLLGHVPVLVETALNSLCRLLRTSRSGTQWGRVETTIGKGRFLFAGAVQRTHNERAISRGKFWKMADGENPRPGRPGTNWASCLADDLPESGCFEAPRSPRKASRWKRCYAPQRQKKVGDGIVESSKRRNIS